MKLFVETLKEALQKPHVRNHDPEFNLAIAKVYREFMKGNDEPLFSMLKTKIAWLIVNKIVDKHELLRLTTKTERQRMSLWIDVDDLLISDDVATLIDCNARIVGHSNVHVFGSSEVSGFDTSFITLHDNSYAMVKECRVHAFDGSSVLARSYAYLELFDVSTARASRYSYVLKHDRSSVSATTNCHVVEFNSVNA